MNLSKDLTFVDLEPAHIFFLGAGIFCGLRCVISGSFLQVPLIPEFSGACSFKMDTESAKPACLS